MTEPSLKPVNQPIREAIMAKQSAKQTGKSYDKVLADMERDFWMSPKEAIEYGIVSRVIESYKDL